VLIGEFELRLFTLFRLRESGVTCCGVMGSELVLELMLELGVGSLSGPEIFNSSKLPLNELDFYQRSVKY
jgi:hypothetical protein